MKGVIAMAATRTDWMRECAECTQLLDALDAADHPALRQWEEVRSHLVEEHLALLPGYDDDCANCQEWKALAGDPGDLKPAIVPVLGREDLLHRAGHLLYATPTAR
jgi:hypothetical protein